MTVDAGKTWRANEMCILGTSHVCLHLSISAFRSQAQVGHINLIPVLLYTHQKVLRLDVSMNDALGMDVLQTTDELVGEH